jgi:hypothetical protein
MSLLFSIGKEEKAFYCPGCKTHHAIDSRWTVSGTLEAPTIRASVLSENPRCHIFVTDGKIEFLSDCEHALAGQTVPMEDLGIVEPPLDTKEGGE